MEPMKPMQPMKPMEPMDFGPQWWPDDLGTPSSSGSQNDIRYAVFPDKQRLAIERGGKTELYDSGDHKISGVAQQQGDSRSLAFSSQKGDVKPEQLKQVS